MRKYIILLISLFSALSSVAQNASNVRVRQEGKSIVITYDLSKKSIVQVLMASGDSDQYVALRAVTGDVGKNVLAGLERKVVWQPLEEEREFIAQNVRFQIDAKSKYEYYAQNAKVKTIVIGQVGYALTPQLSYGGLIGQTYKGIGWYVSGRSNFQFDVASELSCEKGGLINSELPFYNGNTYTSHWIADAGLMINCLEWSSKNKFNTFGVYLGGGYGKRELYLETTDNQWVRYNPTSYIGISADAGIFGSIYGVTLSAGVNTIAFKYMEITVGLGYMF